MSILKPMLILRRIWHLHWLNRHTALTTQVRRTWSGSGHEEVDAGAGEPAHRVKQEVLHHHEGQDLGGQGGKRGLRPPLVLHSQVTRPWQGKDYCLKTNFWKRHHSWIILDFIGEVFTAMSLGFLINGWHPTWVAAVHNITKLRSNTLLSIVFS